MLVAQRHHVRAPQHCSRIDRSNPLSRGLIFFGPIGSAQQDAVTGRVPVIADPTASNRHFDSLYTAIGHESNNTTDGGLRWEDHPLVIDLNNNPNGTILIIAELDSAADWCGFLSVPAANSDPWNDPFVAFGLARDGANTYPRVTWTNGGTNRGAYNATSGFLQFDGTRHMLGLAKSGSAACRFFKDGNFFAAANAGDTSTTNIVLSSSRDIGLFSRNRSASGEGVNGRFIVGAMWSRTLSDAEVLSWTKNPYQLLLPISRLYFGLSDPIPVLITDVDTDESWDDGATGLIAAGSGFV